MPEQFKDLKQHEWNEGELNMIRRLRLAYRGELPEDEFIEMRRKLGMYFDGRMREYDDEILKSRSLETERRQLVFLARFCALLTAGGFGEDAASLMNHVYESNVDRPGTVLMPRREFIRFMRGEIEKLAEHGLEQAIADIPFSEIKIRKPEEPLPPTRHVFPFKSFT